MVLSLAAAGILGGASVLSGIAGSRSSNRAADAQIDAAREQGRVQREIFERNVELQEPFRQAGMAALPGTLSASGLTPTNYFVREREGGPGYYIAGTYGRNDGPAPGGRFVSGDREMLQDWVDRNQYEYTPSDKTAWEDSFLYRDQPQERDPLKWRDSVYFTRDPGGYGMDDFEASPGYQFRLREGEKAIERAGNSQGLTGSGALGRRLVEFGQESASQEYENFFRRRALQRGERVGNYNAFAAENRARAGENRLNRATYDTARLTLDDMNRSREDAAIGRLFNLAGIGEAATARTANAGDTYARGMAGVFGAQGQARAENAVNQGNIFTGTMQNLAGTFGNYATGVYGAPTWPGNVFQPPTNPNMQPWSGQWGMY